MSHASKPEVPVKRKLQLTKAQSGPDRISSRHRAEQPSASRQPSRLLLCDFDKTIADFDAGERTGLFWSKHRLMWVYMLCAELQVRQVNVRHWRIRISLSSVLVF
jgi:hypothetical protein